MTTPFYVALLGIMFILLSVHVIRGRRQLRVLIDDGGNEHLRRRIRAHANFAEYVPFFLIMLGYAEYAGLPVYAVHAFGCLFMAGRLSHAYGLLKAEHYENGKIRGIKYRIRGMQCTFASIGILSLILLGQYALHFYK